MNTRRRIKVYFTPEGEAHFVDPDLSHLPLFQQLYPDFRLQMAWPPHDFSANLSKTKAIQIDLSLQDLTQADDDCLWKIHADGLSGKLKGAKTGSANLLDLKIELARREFLDCRLCGRLCGVNRFLSPGKCGLRDKSYVSQTFVHIGEEAVLTPAASLKIFGCGLSCTGCQAFEIIHVKEEIVSKHARLLDSTIWNSCSDFATASTIEFVGGNPTENLYPILKILPDLPSNLANKPLVWNDHAYTASVTYDILAGLIDVYLPDFKGTDPCVERISGVKNYWSYATHGIDHLVKQSARVIVRVLVLPGHFECCHKPSLQWLAQYRDKLWLSILRFVPDFRAFKDPLLNRLASKSEIAEVTRLMRWLGLRDVDEMAEEFWKN